MHLVALCFALVSVPSALAERHIILVGSPNTTEVFSPNNVTAINGDVVVFRFVGGNHSISQSTFYAPCVLAHDSDPRINGFISETRPTDNGTAITVLEVPIYPQNENTTAWFYDASPHACGWDNTAVGGINLREDSNETLSGFRRNAARLYGPESLGTSKTGTRTRISATSTPTGSSDTSRAYRTVATPLAVPISLIVAIMSVTSF